MPNPELPSILPFTERQKDNQRLATRFARIANASSMRRGPITQKGESYDDVQFRSKTGQQDTIELTAVLRSEGLHALGASGPYEHVTSQLQLPVLEVHQFSHDPRDYSSLVSSPYGRIPNTFIGQDNQLYGASNFYLLNLHGQGAKMEVVTHFMLSELEGAPIEEVVDQFVSVKCEDIPRLPFLPSEMDTRLVSLGNDDYTAISRLASVIETGEYIESPRINYKDIDEELRQTRE